MTGAWRILTGDAITVLRGMDAGSVDMVCTSPPYWALRRYGAGPQEMGSEESAEAYLEGMVGVFREVRRVLADHGTCWVNCGDTYGSGGRTGKLRGAGLKQQTNAGTDAVEERNGESDGNLVGIPERLALALQADGWTWRSTVVWAKPAPMPESVAGWVWAQHRVKVASQRPASEAGLYAVGGPRTARPGSGGVTGVMPEEYQTQWSPCPGCARCAPNGGLVLRRGSWRPTRSHEYIYQFAKGMGAWANAEAVKEAADTAGKIEAGHSLRYGAGAEWGKGRTHPGEVRPSTRNPRSVQSWAPSPQHGDPGKGYTAPVEVSHFAAYPVALADWCIRATCPERVCVDCGAPWAPVVERELVLGAVRDNAKGKGLNDMDNRAGYPRGSVDSRVLGMRPTCAGHGEAWQPGTVLDPFAGTGTTLVAALRLGRRAVGIELNPQYVALSESRICGDSPLFNSTLAASAQEPKEAHDD